MQLKYSHYLLHYIIGPLDFTPFSHMNNIKSSTRSNLGKDSMNDIMEIQINGPSLEDYCPDSVIAHWYDKSNGKRHVDGHKLSSN